jgi:hypothetical protein
VEWKLEMSNKQLSADISPDTIKKAVVSTTLQRPLTVYPATIGLLAGFYIMLFGGGPVAFAAMIGGGSVTLLSWLYEYFIKGDVHANKFVTMFRKDLEKRRVEALRHLEHELVGIQNEQAVNQVKLFRDKYANFQSILDRKLDTTELTYNRYLSIAEQVFLNGLDNLENAAISLKSISTIDVNRIYREVSDLQEDDSHTSQQRLSELKKRLELRETQHNRVNELLLINEKALTQLDQVSAKLANIDTRQSRAHLDMEDAMTELKRLITRAEHYSE